MSVREKANDSAPRKMEYLDIAEYAHTYEKLDNQKATFRISRFRLSIVEVLSGFSHIQEASALFITSDQTNNSEAQIDMKVVSGNSLMFLVLKKACKDDDFMMTEIWKNVNI